MVTKSSLMLRLYIHRLSCHPVFLHLQTLRECPYNLLRSRKYDNYMKINLICW